MNLLLFCQVFLKHFLLLVHVTFSSNIVTIIPSNRVMLHYLLCTAALLSVNVVQSAHKDRAEQVKRMKSYVTAQLEPTVVDDNTLSFSFSAFNQIYEVELWRQTHAAPSNVVHTNVDEEVHSVVSSVEESCHFHGRVVNDESVSIVSASLCENRGLRMRISAFDEILIIKPSAYYLDIAKDAMANHSIEDEVLMYRHSDFERPSVMGTEGVAVADDFVAQKADEMQRRRLYASNNPAENEVTVLIGPVFLMDFFLYDLPNIDFSASFTRCLIF